MTYYSTMHNSSIVGLIPDNPQVLPTIARGEGISLEDGDCGSPGYVHDGKGFAVVGVYCFAHTRVDEPPPPKKRRSVSDDKSSKSSRGTSSVSRDELDDAGEKLLRAVHGVTYYHGFTLCSVVRSVLEDRGVTVN